MSIQTNILPDNPQIEVIKSGKTGLFTNYIYKAIPLAFDESMSYYETLCGLLHYLKNVIIPTVNNNADAVAELQTLYEELRSYVNDYFTNLDVQEEINNKLDAMVEDGQLQEIIGRYLNANAIWGFNNVEDMKQSPNLINGSYAKTLGYHTKNDGGASLYKIRTITNNDNIDNGLLIALNDNQLVAELIVNNEIKVEQFGAYGDGINDDTLSIQNALNTNIYTKFSKIYKISNKLDVDVGFHKGIEGLGNAKIVMVLNELNNYPCFNLYNSLYDNSRSGNYGTCSSFKLKNIIITNITELNDTDATKYGTGIMLGNGCNGLWLENLTLKNLQYGIYAPNTSYGIYNDSIVYCKLAHNDYGVYIDPTGPHDSGENIRFLHSSLSTAKYGNYIGSDMFINITQCSLDYNLNHTLHLKDTSVVSIINSHIEWYASTPLFKLEYNAYLNINNTVFVRSNYDDGLSNNYMIETLVGLQIPTLIINNCNFLLNRVYNNLVDNPLYFRICDCNRLEGNPSMFTKLPGAYTINLLQANNYKYPLNYNSGLNRNSTQVKVTCTTQKDNNTLYVPFKYENKAGKITTNVTSSIDMDITVHYGSGVQLGEGMEQRTGELSQTIHLTANTPTDISFYYRFRNIYLTPYVSFNLKNLTVGATFSVNNLLAQII